MLDEWKGRFDLRAHPEGGWYRETFRSASQVATPRGPRAASTAIVYALPSGEFSAWHRVCHDEIWHHYAGGALRLHQISDSGYREIVLGPGQAGSAGAIVPQAVVPGGVWQAAEAIEDVLVGCTVAPGFDFADFEMAQAERLNARYPDYRALITRLTR